MHAKAATLLLSLSLLLSAAAAQQRAPAARGKADADKVSVRVKSRSAIIVTERGRAHVLDLSKHVDAARIEKASTLFVTRKGDFVYLLLKVCGLSKATPDDRQCGVGIECNIVWLKLDGRWREGDAKSEHYESCWLPITSDAGPKVNGRRLLLEFDDLRTEMRHEVAYDADAPEEGLKVKEYAVPKTP
jgi:hypothetical protein